MKDDLLRQAAGYTRAHQRKSVWYRVVTCLACVVVFCTTYALILPAITLEGTFCDVPEHTHVETCYTQVTTAPRREPVCSGERLGLHRHTEDCFDEAGAAVCGYADFVAHTHDASCYGEDGALWCPLPEIRPLTHDDSCYWVPEAVETEVHTHTEDCYTIQLGELTCTEPTDGGHTHTEDCYTQTEALLCHIPESQGHTHGEGCYDEEGSLICETEESEGHWHVATCWDIRRELTCGQEEVQPHQHTEECYAQNKVLICELPTEPEEPAEDTEPAEPVLVCEKEEIMLHEHVATCFDGNGNLICGKTQVLEHVHSDGCFETVEGPADTQTLTCGLTEGEGAHTHDVSCYDESGRLVCQQAESEGHRHGPLCYGTWELTCELEEHVHSLICYADPTADVETAEDWERSLPRELTGVWAEDVVAVAESQLGYTESTRNYIVDEDNQVKGYTRYGAWFGSPYANWCAMFVSFCLRYANVANVPYSAGCDPWIYALSSPEYGLYEKAGEYQPEPGDIVFFDWEQDGESDHVGIVVERIPATETEGEKLRTIEGNSGNTVRYVTYDMDDPALVGYGRLPEQETGYTCGKVSHTHSTYCYGYGWILCPIEEHVHTEECEIPIEEEKTEQRVSGADYTMCVRYGPEAGLPQGAALQAEALLPDTEAYRFYYQQAVEAIAAVDPAGAETLAFARFFDLRFVLDGEAVEPTGPVEVTITYKAMPELGESTLSRAIHFGQAGTELLDVTVQWEGEAASFTHIQNSFSVVGDLVTLAEVKNPTDIGPSKLPVDYYVCIDGQWVCVGSTKTGWYGDDSATTWTDTNRDYITVEQAASILGEYGFKADGTALNKTVAYQQKSGNTTIYADVTTPTTVNGKRVVPLSRNADHPGYNLYYLPGNSGTISNVGLDSLDKGANGFYTVKVYDSMGRLLASQTVRSGGSFTYDASGSGVASWIVTHGSSSETQTGSTITLDTITAPVTILPGQAEGTGSHSVTFKVMVDGQWKTVGSLPYYFSGEVNGSQRAYITSGMAAQFFGSYGYTAATEPGYHFGYSYNDIYNILFAPNTGYAMDINSANIAENEKVQLYSFNGSIAQTFRIWEAEEGYHYITPVTNSGLHVNVLGGGSANDAPIGLHSATDNSSRWRLRWESDNRVSFWTKNAPDSACIDVDSGIAANGTKIHIWNGTENRYWRLSQVYRISNNAASAKNSDGTYTIGLTAESNGSIVCYYLPAETSGITDQPESGIASANTFWSVSVRDDAHLVYSDGELSKLVQYAQNGGDATITVRNGGGMIWSCVGKDGTAVQVEETQSGGYTTFVIKGVTQPVEVVATKANPSFTVQYYANIDRYVLGSSGDLDIIDTSGGNLPTNSGDQSLLWLTLENIGQNTNQNGGNQTPLHRAKSEKQLTQMYTDGAYNYEQHPGLEYFDKLWGQSNYALDAVLVLKEGRSPDSTNEDDWWWYQINQNTWSNITFTNIAAEENAPRQEGVKQGRDGNYRILLQEGTVLRLCYETNQQGYTNQASFHDYDITGGANADGTWRSGVAGINTDSNYVTSRNGQRKFTWNGVGSSTADVFAFGNSNCETGLGLAQWGGNNINAYNGINVLLENNTTEYYGNGVYQGCTFGLVKGLDASGNLIWDEWITAPHLFNDGDAIGKHSYNNGSLRFNQTGDTYTLTAANSTVGSRDNLEYFFHPSPSSSTTHTHIFTNNFWPMDSAANKTDPLMGALNAAYNQCDIQVNGFWDARNQVGGNHNNVNIPISDDGRAHNWFFGMNFALSFTLTEDYVGPLEYIFFGDDDLWVFLDGRLICDIGGVHSSVGEYVNLWDYLEKGDAQRHTLSFFYTERGASGSTCWMSFTLPSVTSAATGINTGSLQLSKQVEGAGGDYSGVEYQFKVELLTAENGNPLNQTFSYESSDETYGTVRSGGAITLHAGETATISGIPAGTFYRVTELTTQGYTTTVNNSEGYITSGTIENGGTKPAAFVNTPYHELPSTGGPGILLYTFGGIALTAGTLMYDFYRRRRGEK